MNLANGPEIPMGLGMALAQNSEAMHRFEQLTQEQKQQVIEHTHSISSKQEMQSYVQSFFQL